MDCQDLAMDEQGRSIEGNVIQANFTQCSERCFAQARSAVPDLGQRLEANVVPPNTH